MAIPLVAVVEDEATRLNLEQLADLIGGVISPTTAPLNLTAPVITGTPIAGQTLTASTGTWSAAITAYSYAWEYASTGLPIPGSGINSTYLVTGADVGQQIIVVVEATAGGNGFAASLPTVPVVGVPTVTVLPAITGGRCRARR